jgi:hypothetical protein
MRSSRLFKEILRRLKFKPLATPLIALSIVTVSCDHVAVKDKEVCADLGVAGAHCNHLYASKPRDIEKAQWDRQRIGWMCMVADDFSDGEDSIDELCRISNLCDYQTKDQIAQVKQRMAPLVSKARSAKKAGK